MARGQRGRAVQAAVKSFDCHQSCSRLNKCPPEICGNLLVGVPSCATRRPAELLNGPHPPLKLKAWADCDDDFIAVRLRRGRAAEWALSPERTVAVLYARPRGYKPTITAETCALRRRPFVIAHASDTDIPRLGLPPTAVCQRLLYEHVPYVLNLHCHSTFCLLEYKLREENTAAQNT